MARTWNSKMQLLNNALNNILLVHNNSFVKPLYSNFHMYFIVLATKNKLVFCYPCKSDLKGFAHKCLDLYLLDYIPLH